MERSDMKVLIRLRPFSRKERATCGEVAVRISNANDVVLGVEAAYCAMEAPTSVGRQLAARVASRQGLDLGDAVATPTPEKIPFADRSNVTTPSDWEQRVTPTPPQTPLTPQKKPPSRFTFDRVFGPNKTTEQLYDEGGVSDIVDSFLGGFNGTVFAYGQTGSGKTFTMDGVVDLAVSDVFSFIEDASRSGQDRFLLRASILEVYNERVTDLLVSDGGSAHGLRLLDNKSGGVVVEGLSEVKVDTQETLLSALQTAKLNRMTASTKVNERSSRSHLMVRLTLERRQEGSRMLQLSCLNLVDLAGSERVHETKTSGLGMKESCSINQSLLCLGNVVSRLAERSAGHIPYRDSKLTRLLQHAIGGNSKTAMICTISPGGGWHLEQTRGTLSFASRAMNITNLAKKNLEAEDDVVNSSLLLKYEKEIEGLKFRLEDLDRERAGENEEVQRLKKKIEGMTKVILNYFHGPREVSTPVSASHYSGNRHGKVPKVYTTLGLVSPGREGTEVTPSAPPTAQLFSPLLQKYREARKKQQEELLALHGHVASLKEGRLQDKALLEKQMLEFEAEIGLSEKEITRLQESNTLKDDLLAERSKCIDDQAKEISNLKALNKRLCEEANRSREERNEETARLRELEKQQEEDIHAAQQSAMVLEAQIANLEGSLDKIGSKAALVSPAVRRVKELEEALEVKTTQLKNVEEKVVEKVDTEESSGEKGNFRKRNKFDARKLLRFSSMLETALVKMQGWTGSNNALANSPNTPRLPLRSTASVTWEHEGGLGKGSPHTPENLVGAHLSDFRKQELGLCIREAMTSCKLFKSQVESLYAALQDAEEANDGQQVLLTVVAQEHAKKTSQWELELARLKREVKESSDLASLQMQSRKDLDVEWQTRALDMERTLAGMREEHGVQVNDMLSQLQQKEAKLLRLASEFSQSETLYEQKLRSLGAKQAKKLGETLQFREEELRAEASKKLEDALQEQRQKLVCEHIEACAEIRDNLEARHEERLKNLQAQQANASFEFDAKLKVQENQLAEDMMSALASQETELGARFEKDLQQALEEQKRAITEASSAELSEMLRNQKASLEAFAAEQMVAALADVTEQLTNEKDDALSNLRMSLEQQSREALEKALGSKASEADAILALSREEHANELALIREEHARQLMQIKDELTRANADEKAWVIEEERSRAEASLSEAKIAFEERSAKEMADALTSMKASMEAAFAQQIAVVEGNCESDKERALEQQRLSLEEEGAILRQEIETLAKRNDALFSLQEALEKQADAAIASLQDDHAKEVAQLKEEAAQAAAAKEIKEAELKQEHEEDLRSALARQEEVMEMLTVQHAREIAGLEEEHASAMSRLRADLAEAAADDAADAMNTLREQHAKEIAGLREEHASEVARLREELAQSVRNSESAPRIIEFERDSVEAKLSAFKDTAELQAIVKLWKDLHVPLRHRSRFVGSLVKEDANVLSLEMHRLQWLKEAMTPDQKVAAAKKLAGERQDLIKKLRATPYSTKEALLASWGYSKEDKKRKESLVRKLFEDPAQTVASATVVLYLDEFDRKGDFIHFASFYFFLL
ncbi:kinesin [Chloropicon primus]|uniref:Kinesin n=1 Tax=Chloropicon primus TaxID=1764295 RepID=A0A5B8MPD4_9CHLO|nr:kinesin [Chloropicon primus]|eukprot:QDZ22287.1 kinesin [Chloropicon primus]